MAPVLNSLTDRYFAALPDGESWLTPDDLLRIGYPDFLVARIRVEIEQNLAESVRLPDSDWADMHAIAVQDAWHQFLDAIRAETRIPIAYLRPVLETSLEDVVDQLTNPRKAIPDYLFGTMTELDVETVAHRASRIRIYPHLLQALVRHMHRRNLQLVTKSEVGRVIAAVDDIYCKHFTALSWGQMLAPLFDLSPEGIDPDWAATYFRSRGMTAVADSFADAQGLLSKGGLIERLSRPHFEDVECEDTVELVPEVAATAHEVGTVVGSPEEFDAGRPMVVHDRQDAAEPEDQDSPEDIVGAEIPIWQRFAPSEEPDHSDDDPFGMGMEAVKADPKDVIDDEPEVRPLIDLYSRETDTSGSRVFALMADVKEDVVAAIFGGDENAYDAALLEIARFTTYAEAGRYIKRDILDRNRIDLYSDEAAFFLDRIQTYFLETT